MFCNVFYVTATLQGVREFNTEGYLIYSFILEAFVRFLPS